MYQDIGTYVTGQRAVLEIERGTTVKIQGGEHIYVGHSSNNENYDRYPGGLRATGVTFTSLDSTGWAGIYFQNSALDDTNYTLIDSCIIENATDGIYSNSSSPTIRNSTIRNNTDGIHADASQPMITGNTFTGNTRPVSIQALYIDENIYGNTYSGNTKNYIEVQEGTINENRTYTWKKDGAPYVAAHTISVQRTSWPAELSTLEIESGTTVMFASGKYLWISESSYATNGALSATGVTFTALDTSVGWGGIYYLNNTDDGSSLIDSCIVEYATMGIYCQMASPTIRNSTIRNNTDGIHADANSQPIITGNTFRNNNVGIKINNADNGYSIGGNVSNKNSFNNNSSYGVYNYDTGGDSLNATYIHWGSGSGPYHSTNVHGKGDAVGGKVDFSNWIGMDAVDSISVTATTFGPQLAWSELQNNNVVKYFIFRSTDSTTSVLHDSTVSTELYYIDDQAVRDSVYYYRVAAVDNSSDHGRLSSYAVSGIVPFNMNFDFSNIDVNHITLYWSVDVDTSINEYQIYRSTNDSIFALIDSVESTDTTFTDTALLEGVQYWYKIKAENNNGKKTSFSETKNTFTRLYTPTDLNSSTISEYRIDLTWIDHTDQEDGYLVERRFLEVDMWNVIDTLSLNTNAYIDSSLNPSTVYVYQVKAYNDNGAVSNPSISSIIMTDLANNTSYGTISSITDTEGLTSDTVSINYFSQDPNGGYAITQDWQFSRDGFEWFDISETEILDNTMSSPGNNSIRWLTRSGINNLNHIEDPTVWFRMKLFNLIHASAYIYSTAAYIDNNMPPSATLAHVIGEQTGDINFEFETNDVENDEVSITGEFSLDAGLNWSEASLSDVTQNTPSYFSLSFDGVDDYVYRDDAIFDADGNWTLSGWVYITTTTSVNYIFGTSWEGNHNENSMGFYINPGLTMWRQTSAGGELDSDSYGTIIPNTWQHVAVTYDGSTVVFYINGLIIGSEPWTTGTINSTDIALGVQRRNRGGVMEHYFNGNIDEFSLWDNALTQSEIQANMSVELSGSETGLIGYWNFNEGAGTTVFDATSNGNDGTIHGATWSADIPFVPFYNSSGSFSWQTTIDLNNDFDRDGVSFRLIAQDVDPGIPTQQDSIHIDLNNPPSVIVTDIYAPQVADVTIYYQLADETNDTLSIIPQYLSDTTWVNATTIGQLSGLTDYTGSLTWLSTNDLGRTMNAGVKFRIIPMDNDSGYIDETLPMVVDNIQLPYSQIMTPTQEVYGNHNISFDLIDLQEDTLNLLCQYSADNGITWQNATISGSVYNIVLTDTIYSGTLTWMSNIDLYQIDNQQVRFRIFPSDENGTGVGATTNNFHVDNNSLPTIVLSPINYEESDTVEIQFVIHDSTSDLITIIPEYSIDGGVTWDTANVNGLIADLADSLYSGNITWPSERQTEGLDIQNMIFRITPYDIDSGVASTISFHLDNNRIPSISLINFVHEVHDSVEIWFDYIDSEQDDYILETFYSLDSGYTWLEGTNIIQEGSTQLDLGIWLSGQDLPNYELNSVQLIVVPYDNDVGVGDTSNIFTLDNYQGQKVILNDISGEQADSISFTYTIIDTTSDTNNIAFEYLLDNNWYEFDVLGLTENISSNSYLNNSVIWISSNELPGQELDSLMVRCIPNDGWGIGTADTISFYIDNNIPPSVDITNITSEQHGDVTILYTTYDPEEDNVSFVYEYSIGGSIWYSASYTSGGRTADISIEENKMILFDPIYSDDDINQSTRNNISSIVWNSFDDRPDVDIDNIYFRIIPSDIDEGTQDQTGPFNLDNYQGHTIILDPINDEQSDDVLLTYTLTDTTEDELGIQFKFSIDNGVNWDVCTISGDTSQLGSNTYNGTITWSSIIDMNNLDLINTRIKAITHDYWMPSTSSEIIIHVDNETGPLLSSYISGIMPLPHQSIDIEFDRPMDPSTYPTGISLSSELTNFNFSNLNFETNASNNIVNIFSPNGIPAFDTIIININNSVKDHLGKSFDGNRDGDPSGIDDNIAIKIGTYLLGDFDMDKNIDAADIDQFTMGWYGNDGNYELGPITGDVPHLISVPDGSFDIDDLMSFIISWNWAKQNGMLARTIVGDFQDDAIHYTWDGHYLNVGFNEVIDLQTIHLQILDHDNISFIDGEVLNDKLIEIDNNLFFIDTLTNDLDITLSTIKPMNISRNDWIISIPLQILGREMVRTDLKFEYFLDGVQHSGRKELKLLPIPESYHLSQNYPNPFNPITNIQYDIPEEGHIQLIIYDLLGRKVRTLVNKIVLPGYKSIKWDGKNDNGSLVTSGVYFYMIQAGNFSKTKKMIILK